MNRLPAGCDGRTRPVPGLLLLILCLAVSVSHAGTAEDTINEARRKAASKDYAGAVELYDAVLAAEPGNLDALNGKARALGWAKEYEDAEMVYREGLATAPDNVESLTGLADIYAWQGAHEEGIGLLKGSLDKHPRDREVLIRLARYHLWACRHDESIYYADRVLDIEPADGEAIDIRRKILGAGAYESCGGYYHLSLDGGGEGHNVFFGLKYEHSERYRLSCRIDYLDRYSEKEGRLMGGGTMRLRDDLNVSAELSLAPGALIFPVAAGRAEAAYVTRPFLILYGTLNVSHYKSVDLFGASAAGEYYVSGRTAVISRVSLVHTEFDGGRGTTTAAWMVKAIRFFNDRDRVFAWFSYGTETYLIETIDRIGDVDAKTFGLGAVFSAASPASLSPRFEIQDLEGGRRNIQTGLEFSYSW